MGVPIFPRPTNPTGVFEAIDRDDTEGGIERQHYRCDGKKKKHEAFSSGVHSSGKICTINNVILLLTVQLISLTLVAR